MRSFLKGIAWVVVLGLLLFYGGGGWYFSNQLIADGFEPAEAESALATEIVAFDEGTITLAPTATEDPERDQPGVYGLHWPAGYGRIGEIVSEDGEIVVREVVGGPSADRPDVGDVADVDPFAFPEGIPTGWDELIVESAIGEMPGWFGPADESTWVIHVHGKGAPLREALRAATALQEAGYPQLIMSYRNDPAAPSDPSGRYQYGRTEWVDLEAALDLARMMGAERLVLYGYSTGGAVIGGLIANGGDVSDVVGMVLDAPNIDFATTVDFNAAQRELPIGGFTVPASLAVVARTITTWRIGVDWDAIDYTETLVASGLPILVFHGTDDATVPIVTSERLASNSDQVFLERVGGAEHVQSWNAGPDDYEATIVKWVATMVERGALTAP